MLRFLLVSSQIALRALRRNTLRTVLTMLGIIIGVAAVIAMVALGSGARGSVETSLKSAGTNIIQVSAGNYTRGGESMNIASGLVTNHEAARPIPTPSAVSFIASPSTSRSTRYVSAPSAMRIPISPVRRLTA